VSDRTKGFTYNGIDLGPLPEVKIPAGETITCQHCEATYVNDRWLAHPPEACIAHLRAENGRLRAVADAAHQLADVATSTATTVMQLCGSTPGSLGHTIAAGLTKAASLVRDALASSGRVA
jgi:hypothetical protein